MKKRNGFTLIELLAVIIILAVVALIATPIVLNVVNDAKKSAAESEANYIISGIEGGCATKIMQAQMAGATQADKDLATACEKTTLDDTQVKTFVNMGNASLVGSTVTLSGGKVTAITVSSNGYTVTLSGGSLSLSK